MRWTRIVALLLLMLVMVCAQPQYRVVVDPPYLVSAIPSDVLQDSLFVILCFREENSMSTSQNYCPLGFDVRQANPSVNEQPIELTLMNGAENIPPEYPLIESSTANLGVGLLVTITGIRDTAQETLATQVVPRAGGAPGTLFTRANARIGGSGSIVYTIKFRVDCLPEFTGLDCTTPAPPTTAPPTTAITTTTPATTQTPNTPEMTTATQAMTPTTSELSADGSEGTVVSMGSTEPEETSEVPGVTTGASASSSEGTPNLSLTSDDKLELCTASPSSAVHPQSLGIGFVVGFLTATVLALLLGTTIAATCCLLKRGRRQGTGDDADKIEMSRNPLYGARQDGPTTNTAC